MSKKFTKLIAALALLVFMMPSMAGWGQVSTATAENGYSYVVAYYANNKYYALPHGTSASVWDATEVSLNSINKVNTSTAESLAWTLTEGNTSGQFYLTYTSGSSTYYLYKNGGTSNTNYNIKGSTSTSERHYWEFTLNSGNSDYTIKSLKSGTGTSIYLGYASVGKYGVYAQSNAAKIILLEIGDVPSVPYEVTLGDNGTILTETSAGAGVTLPSRDDIGEYTFAGWNTTNITEETTTAPAIIPVGLYHPTADVTLYPVYTRTANGATTWSLVDKFNNVSEGVYAILSSENRAFIGTMASGNGESTSTSFVFGSDGLATTVPDGICEITMISYDGGYKMYNENYGYLYVDGTSAGHLIWSEEPAKWNVSYTTNWVCSFDNTTVYLRSYTNNNDVTTFRTYSSATQSRIYMAKKGTGIVNYYISSLSFTVTYNANGGNGEDFVDDNSGERFEYGANVTVLANEGTNNPNFTKTGHSFAWWSDMEDWTMEGANVYDPDDEDEITITGNETLYAQWDVNKYNVAIVSVANVDLYAEYGDNDMLVEDENADIDYGTTLTLTADNLAQGSAFVWQVTDGDNNDVTDEVLNGNVLTVPAYDITISGSVELTYMVVFDSNGIETIVSQIGNSVFSLTAPTNVPTGFTFVGWTMYETELNVDDLLEGTTVDLSDYDTDNASLYAVFSGEVGAFPAIPATAGSFVKVEEELSDWSGTYLIVFDGRPNPTNEYAYPKAFDGSLNNLDVSQNIKDVTITSGKIDATETLLAAVFTIANDYSNDVNHPYTIKSASGYYIGHNGSGNGFSSSSTVKYGNSIQYDNDEERIIIKGAGNTPLQYLWSGSSSRFKYYSSTQEDIQLYKFVEGTSGAPAVAGTTQRFIRVFQNETAEDDVFILGPSIIPSGYYLDMGEKEIYSFEPDMFIIEDGGQLISDQDEVYATVLKNIRSYNNGGGWNFVASPIFTGEGLNPSTVGMVTTQSDYDLYLFNPNAVADNQGITKEWENYKAHQNEFLLYNGHGYLYANEEDVVLQFSGLVNSPDAVVSYDYDVDSDSELKDWNLVGNPYMYEAYPNTSYYVVNGFGVEPKTNSKVAPCEGIMIQGTEGSVNFTREPEETSNPSNLQMTVAQQVVNRSGASIIVNDKSILSFNEGDQLGKFYFGDNAKLYIPQDNKEYAIVSSEGQGTMPVNFRANEDGNYTLTVNLEGVEMNYLHLIDNMTGNDIDLLQTSSYSFNATTNDYESRFRLVFAAANNEDGASTGSAAFAFMSDGNWIINNVGEATLQVIDLNGRILSSERVNGSVSKTINATPGVYMLRLINGENVMVQKIVVR